LLGDDEGAAAKGDEELAHDYVPDVDVRLAEGNHARDAEHGHWRPEEEGVVLDFTVVAEQCADDYGSEAGPKGVNVPYVGGCCDRLVKENDVEGVEVRVPDVPACVQTGGHDEGEEDGAVLEELDGDEFGWCNVFLIEDEGDDEEDADDDEGDDERGAEAGRLVGVDAEAEEEEGETSGEDEEADDIELFGVVDESL